MRALLATLVCAVTLLPFGAGADELTAIIQTDLQTLGYETGAADGEMTVQTAIAISKFQAENSLDVTGEASPQLAGVIKAALKNGGQLPPQAPATAAAPAPRAAPAQQAQAPQSGSAFGAIAGAVAPSMMQGMVSGAAGVDPAALQMLTGGEPQSTEMDPEDLAALQAQMAQMMGGATGVDPAMIQAVQAEAMQQQQADQAQQACLQQKIADAQAAQESAQRRRGLGSLMRAVSRLGGDEIASSVAGITGDIAEADATINDLQSAARDLGLTEEEVASCGAAR